MFGILVIVAVVNFWLLVPTVIMLSLFFYLRKLYMKAGRSVKRIEAQSEFLQLSIEQVPEIIK